MLANDVGYEYIDEESINERLKCSICTMPFIEPVITNCRLKRHTFCRRCIKEWIRHNPSCPSCRDKIVVKDLKVITESYLLDSLNELQVKCKYCGQTGLERAKFEEHQNRHCTKVLTLCPLADLQCPWKGPVDQVDKHLNSCVFKPLSPLITHLKDQINELRVSNQQLEKRLRKTESKFYLKSVFYFLSLYIHSIGEVKWLRSICPRTLECRGHPCLKCKTYSIDMSSISISIFEYLLNQFIEIS